LKISSIYVKPRPGAKHQQLARFIAGFPLSGESTLLSADELLRPSVPCLGFTQNRNAVET